jgi:hypothetical protein
MDSACSKHGEGEAEEDENEDMEKNICRKLVGKPEGKRHL